MGFQGFSPEALSFFEGLEAENTKRYWDANKRLYETSVRGPMLALIDEVPDEWKPMHVFRPNRDLRFSPDKSPYKMHIGAVGEREGGAIGYVQLSSTGLLAASGYYGMAADQLQRYRRAVDDHRRGGELAALVGELRGRKLAISGIGQLRTAPRGFARDHPRVELLRYKGLAVSKAFPVAKWLWTGAALAKVVGVWRAGEPVNAWLEAHVGPSTMAPDDLE